MLRIENVALVMALVGCACASHPSPTRLQVAEVQLRTQKKDDWLFHRLVEDPQGLGLRTPGFIVGLEKSSLDHLGMDQRVWMTDPAGWRREEGSPFWTKGRDGRVRDKLSRILHQGRESPRRSLLTHILEFRPSPRDDSEPRSLGFMQSEIRYSAYEPCMKERACDYEDLELPFRKGIEALKNLRQWLAVRIREDQPTHLLLICMGWNTNQQEAIRNFNSIAGYLRRSSTEIRPLVVGVTWDSVAIDVPILRALSYFSKAKDADEVGAVWLNMLLRYALLPAKSDTNLPLVVVGHSFGARALGTALASSSLLREPSDSSATADLFLAVQGAFSLKRFVDLPRSRSATKPISDEGAPLRRYADVAGKWVLTWSEYDTANPKATFWTGAAHAGGRPGYRFAVELDRRLGQEDQLSPFEFCTWSKVGWNGDHPTAERAKITLVDASAIVRHKPHQKGGTAHSDIYSDEMAELMSDLFVRFAP